MKEYAQEIKDLAKTLFFALVALMLVAALFSAVIAFLHRFAIPLLIIVIAFLAYAYRKPLTKFLGIIAGGMRFGG
jgi:hypothetical protein